MLRRSLPQNAARLWLWVAMTLSPSCGQEPPETGLAEASSASLGAEYCSIMASFKFDVVGTCQPKQSIANSPLNLEAEALLSGPPQPIACAASHLLMDQACQDSLRELIKMERMLCKESFSRLLATTCKSTGRNPSLVNCMRSLDERTQRALPPICTFQNPNRDATEESTSWYTTQACATYRDN